MVVECSRMGRGGKEWEGMPLLSVGSYDVNANELDGVGGE